MAARSEFQKWLQRSRKSWMALTQGALWLCGILGGFLLPPPVGFASGDDKIWLRLGQFVIAVLLGLVFLTTQRWNQPRHSLRWAGAAAVFLAVAVAAFFCYQQLMLAWTCNYSGDNIVIGSVFTPHGLSYRQKHPEFSYDELVSDFTGKTDEIWTRESINRRRLILAAIYVSCLPLFTICLIAVVQGIQCRDRMTKRGAKPQKMKRERPPPR